jgi:hypothetical protein
MGEGGSIGGRAHSCRCRGAATARGGHDAGATQRFAYSGVTLSRLRGLARRISLGDDAVMGG